MSKDPLNTLGASNHSSKERSLLDYYGTDPRAVEALYAEESFSDHIWEPCAGHNNIVNVFRKHGHIVKADDIFDYGYGNNIQDFFESKGPINYDIVTNPPYNEAEAFVRHALDCVTTGTKVAMLLRLQFLEGQSRYKNIFEKNPPTIIYVFTNRQVCSKVDDFTEGSAIAYCWVVWIKGNTKAPIIKWLSTK